MQVVVADKTSLTIFSENIVIKANFYIQNWGKFKYRKLTVEPSKKHWRYFQYRFFSCKRLGFFSYTVFPHILSMETILIWKLQEIQIVAANFNFLPDKLHFCSGNYSWAETLRGNTVTCPTENPYLFFKKTYWAARASSSGTILFLLTEPRLAIFGEIAGAVIRSSVKINYYQNLDIFVILTSVWSLTNLDWISVT